MNKKLRRELAPISFLKGVEPDLKVFDLLVEQQALEELDYENADADELACEIRDELCMADPLYRRYLSKQPNLSQIFTVDYDEYPVPIRGPGAGIQVQVCLSKGWSKDWGGEIIAYEECEPSEIVASYPGRVVVSHNDAWWKVSQPNIEAKEKLIYLFFTLN